MPAQYPDVVRAENYARNVLNGSITACRWTRLACQRHFDDKERSKKKGWLFRFDREKAQRACRFIQLLGHVKGEWAGTKLILSDWQCFIVSMLYGWVFKDSGLRRFIKADIMVPRKNGKSTFVAPIGLYMLVADDEAGAEIYAGATSEYQAYEVFRPAQQMAARGDFARHFNVEVNKRNINQLKSGSRFEPLIGRPGDGASPSCAIHDEYHEHPDDSQVDTMRTGMGARKQPLQIIITTAGSNLEGPCYAEFQDAKKVLEGTIINDRLFAIIYTVDDGDDWTSEEALIKANPNYDVSVSADFLKQQQAEAKHTPRKRTTFLTKHLNIWVGAMKAYFSLDKWKLCLKPDLRIEDFYGKECFIALDLATKIDLVAKAYIFPLADGRYAAFLRYYLPRATVMEAGKDHYRAWELENSLTVTDGEVVDFDRIRDDLKDDCANFDVQHIAYDPWQATQLAQELMKEGAPVLEYRNTVANMSEPMKMLDALMRSVSIEHEDCPITQWCIGNVIAKEDAKANVFPRKEREANKIDGAVALIMCLGATLFGPSTSNDSVYNTQDIVIG